MDTGLYLAFLLVSFVLIVVPGPNVLVIVSTSLSFGTRRGLQVVLGTSTAMLIQLVVAAVGTSWLVASISSGLDWLRWLGVIYLVYLGLSHLYQLAAGGDAAEYSSATLSFSKGFFVSLTNPKTIVFFSAFLPQFVSVKGDYTIQIAMLSLSFLVLAVFLDSLYALLAGRISKHMDLNKTEKTRNGISGILYLVAALWLGISRKSQV